MKPNFPVILIYNRALDLIPDEENLTKTSLYGFLKDKSNSKAYDNQGKLWELKLHSEKFRDDFITRILANTIYNPKIKVTPKWNVSREYNLIELKSIIKKLIENDDDIFTQFIEAEILIRYVDDAKTFQEIYKILLNVFEFEG